jgi:hypothetical protein
VTVPPNALAELQKRDAADATACVEPIGDGRLFLACGCLWIAMPGGPATDASADSDCGFSTLSARGSLR